jgi:hypothetical protein
MLGVMTVGYGLQVAGGGQLSDPAPSGGVAVTITSNTPNTVLLSTSATTAGSNSIILTVPAGQTALPVFYVQGVAIGSGQLQASAAGYQFNSGQNNNGAVAITPSGFVLAGPSGIAGQGFSTTATSTTADSQLILTVMRLDAGYNPVQTGQLAGGATVLVSVTSGTPTVGTIVNNPATFQGGNSSNATLYFHPLALGSSVLSVVQPLGFSSPSSGGQLTATVSLPQITLNIPGGTNLGQNLQLTAVGSLNTPAPAGGMNITISSSDTSKAVLSSTATAAGTSSSITIAVAGGSGLNGFGFPSFYVQGLQSSGSVTLTATAANWGSGTITVNLTPSGFVLIGPQGMGNDFGTYSNSGQTPLTVQAMQLDPVTNAPQVAQAVAGGLSEIVSVSSGSSSVGTIPNSPVTIHGGSASGSVSFQPVGIGKSLLTVTPPAGFTTPLSGATLNAVVD